MRPSGLAGMNVMLLQLTDVELRLGETPVRQRYGMTHIQKHPDIRESWSEEAPLL